MSPPKPGDDGMGRCMLEEVGRCKLEEVGCSCMLVVDVILGLSMLFVAGVVVVVCHEDVEGALISGCVLLASTPGGPSLDDVILSICT